MTKVVLKKAEFCVTVSGMGDAKVVADRTARALRLIKVLIIDDEPDIVETLSHHFRNAGAFTVEKA